MTKKILTILFSFVAALSYALPIECVGTATQVVNGKDTTFIFKDEIHLKSTSGAINWYYADSTLYASGVDEIFPEDGCYIAEGFHFCVELYKGIDDLTVSLEPTCESTLLHISGTLGARARAYTLSYNALVWDGEAWTDSAVVQTGTLVNPIMMPALYGATPITLCYDADIRTALDMDSACVETELLAEDIKALKMQLTSLATARGNENEPSNELNRPVSQTLVVSSDYSGPLEVAFYSNPTPAVRFYNWHIYQSTDLLASRHDQDIRYTFSNPGSYRIVCAVNNADCTSDSTEMTVAISESYLKVPNVFTPNGDGKNDEFRVAYRSIKEFHIWVYNRWGKLVYESTDPMRGWDGTIGGKKAAEGAYFYVIRALGTDAPTNAQYMMKAVYNKKKLNSDEAVIGVYQLSGDINLIR